MVPPSPRSFFQFFRYSTRFARFAPRILSGAALPRPRHEQLRPLGALGALGDGAAAHGAPGALVGEQKRSREVRVKGV